MKISKLIVVAFLLLTSSPAFAAWHLYLVPVVGDGSQADPRRPKYAAALKVPWAAVDLGAQPIMLVAADVSPAQDAAAAANGDVTKIPDNLDTLVTAGTLAAVQNALESRNMPGNWITVGTSYRTICRTIISVSLLLQRFGAVRKNYGTPILTGGVTLSTTFSSLPQAARDNLITAATQLQIDTSGFTGASTIGQILKGVADQWASVPRTLGGVTI